MTLSAALLVVVVWIILVLLAHVPAAVSAAISRRVVPPDGKIVIQDYGARDWGPELVQFQLDTGRFVPGQLVLTDAQGRAVPFQIEGDMLAFVASVGKGQSVAYKLAAAAKDCSAENSTLKCSVQGDWFEAANEFLALRCPKPGAKSYAAPIEAAAAPAPLAQWKPAGVEQWIGGARFATARKVTACTFSLLHQGPAFVEYEARYRFEPAGQYVLRVRLAAGVPLAAVTEEFDFGAVTGGEDLLLLELHKGWQPARICIATATGEGSTPGPLEAKPFQKYIEERRKTGLLCTASVGGFGVPPDPYFPEPGLAFLEKIVPGAKWGGLTGGIQLLGVDEGRRDAGAPSGRRDAGGTVPPPFAGGGRGRGLGIAALHLGSWRRAMALNVWHKDGVGLMVGLPLSVRRSRWYLDITDDISPFSTHEHDEGLAQTYGRREWCLYYGGDINTAQPRFGLIGLDRYKDWVVSCPESKATRQGYPRAFFTRQLAERLRKTLEQHLAKAEVGSYYIVSGKTADAVKHAQDVIQGLKADPTVNWQAQGLTHYRQAQFLAFVNKADDALACPDLPAELCNELRLWLALWANLLSDPDIVPRGSGVHHGNPNMTINRTLALSYFAGLLPDHPLYGYWMEHLKAWTAWKLASQTAFDGPFIEPPLYSVYGPVRHLLATTMILHNTGVADLSQAPYLRRFLEYFAGLSMADPRFGGRRIVPGMGNSANLAERLFGISLAVLEQSQKDAVGFFKFMHRMTQGNELTPRWEEKETAYALWYLPDIPEQPRELKTTLLPTYGVIFRAHFNQLDETAMLFRAGFNWSHWDTDSLNAILYSQGAPLSPGTGYQYYSGVATEHNGIYHNRVKIERPDLPELFGRVDTGVVDYGFSGAADYALGDRFYPGGLFADGKSTVWRRHIVFLKDEEPGGPNYFVLRDTFPGGEHRKKWWNWLNLGKQDMVAVNGQDLELKTPYGASTRVWFSRPHEIKPRLTFDALRHDGLPGNETKTIVEAAAQPGEDFFYVVYPHKDGVAVPPFERPGGGCLKIVTSSAVDYVFANDVPVKFEKDGVLFEGKAGAVRVYKDKVALSLLAGSGRIGYRGAVFAGHGPFQRTLALAGLKPGTTPVNDTYEKKWQTVDIGGISVEAEGPFEAKLEGQSVRIRTTGRARVLRMTRPDWMLRPQLWVDGVEYMACWTDYPGSKWGRLERTNLVSLAVPEGAHELLIKNMVFPPVWERPFKPAIESALVK